MECEVDEMLHLTAKPTRNHRQRQNKDPEKFSSRRPSSGAMPTKSTMPSPMSMELPDHDAFTERLRRTLYYGKMPDNDRPSFDMTEIAVEVIQKAAPRELGRVDMQWAASVGRCACISPCSLMLGMLYIERLRHKNPEYLQQISSSELFLISMMVASKYLYDEGIEEEVFNDEWAESAKMETSDINLLERNFLSAIDWSLFTDTGDFESMLNIMEHRIAWNKGRERGWLTYTDLLVLCRDQKLLEDMRKLLQGACQAIVVCTMAYIAGCLTMFGSVMALRAIQTHLPAEGLTASWPALPPSREGSVPMPTPTTPQLAEQAWGMAANHQLMDPTKPGQNAMVPEIPAEKDVRFDRSGLMALPLNGLLTLVLIKETLVKFALGVKEKFHHRGSLGENSTRDTVSETGAEIVGDHSRIGPCNCVHCPLRLQHSNNSNYSLIGGLTSSRWLALSRATVLKMNTPILPFEREMGGNGQAANKLCPHGASGLPDCAGPPAEFVQQAYSTYHVTTIFSDLANRHHTAGQTITQ